MAEIQRQVSPQVSDGYAERWAKIDDMKRKNREIIYKMQEQHANTQLGQNKLENPQVGRLNLSLVTGHPDIGAQHDMKEGSPEKQHFSTLPKQMSVEKKKVRRKIIVNKFDPSQGGQVPDFSTP